MKSLFLSSHQQGSAGRNAALYKFLLATLSLGIGMSAQSAEPAAVKMESGFNPYGGATELVVKTINSASQSIFIASEDVSSGPVVQALTEARKRGVNVLAVLDKSQEKQRYRGAKILLKAGINVHIDRKHSAMRNNYIVVDGQTLAVGRFSYTEASAKKNADNVLVIWNNPTTAKSYRANWQEHWDHSDPYK